MKILAIETSCDDTGIAILDIKGGKFKALSNIVSSQEIHKNYGGVFPMMAKREHQNNIITVLKESLQKAKLLKIQKSKIKNQKDNAKFKIIEKIMERENQLFKFTKDFLEKYEKPEVDLIAVTNGPGLEPCLWVGVNFAKALSCFWDIPIIPVNHIEAHIAVNFLENKKIDFPAISLVVSGGHTQLILVKKIGEYEIIGETRDDAAGECFDKCAKILGLGYPGGPIISKIASQAIQKLPLGKLEELPRPMINSKDYDLSFSGLKTAVLYKVKGKKLTDKYVEKMCMEVQQSIIDVLIKKTINAAKNYKVKTIILGGGVSANSELRSQFEMQNLKIKNQNDPPTPRLWRADNAKFKIIYPPKELSTDNALMIAVVGYFNRNKKIAWQNLSADANLRISK